MTAMNWVFAVIGLSGVLGVFVFVPVGIAILIKAENLPGHDRERKRLLNYNGLSLVLLPFVMIFFSVIGNSLFNIISRALE